MLKPGSPAPAFTADSTAGIVALEAFLGKKNIVLIFYPGDDTPICTKQLCAIRDSYAAFEDENTVVFGINPADRDKHQAFAGKFGYRFPLIVDDDESIRKLYDVGKVLGFLFQQRIVYIIGEDGNIFYAKKGNPPVSELLQAIRAQKTGK